MSILSELFLTVYFNHFELKKWRHEDNETPFDFIVYFYLLMNVTFLYILTSIK